MTESTLTRRLVQLAPLLCFTLIYCGTCLLGAVLLLVNWRPFVALWEYFSGNVDPTLHGSALRTCLLLLFACPALMWLGYCAVAFAPINTTAFGGLRNREQRLTTPDKLPIVV